MIGLPGSGLGGVFYALLIVWMFIREVWLLVIGKSSARQWVKIRYFVALLTGMLLVLSGEVLILQYFMKTLSPLNVSDASAIGAYDASASGAYNVLLPALTLIPFVMLGVLVFVLKVVRVILIKKNKGQLLV